MRLCCYPFFQSSVMGLRAPLGWRLLGLRWPRREAERKGNFKRVNADSVLSLIFPSSSSSSYSSSSIISAFSDSPFGLFFLLFFWPFLIVSSLVHLLGYSCKGSSKVVRICLSWLQCSYLAYFNKIGFSGTLMR